MRKPISRTAFCEGDSSLTFKLNEIANKRRQEGASVINVTVGSLYNDKGELVSFSKINELIADNLGQKSNSYAPIDGGEIYKRNVIAWVFGDYKDSLMEKYFSNACVTPGGTGALYLAFRNYSDDNPILLPDIGWNNYKVMCGQLNKKYEVYSMFDNGVFDLECVLDLSKKSIETYGSCTLVINDPCQNPTGYTLSDDEWKKMIESLNELNNLGPVNLILDVAYMDLADEPRRFFKHIALNKAQFNTLVCFSASKLLGVYGARLGALICINTEKENVEEFSKSSKTTARAVWSNCNHLLINAFNDLCSKEDMIPLLFSELETSKKLLKDRYIEARKLFDGIFECEPLPYKEGFFITYPKEGASEFSKELIKKDIFVLPLEGKYIRIGICSFYKN